MLSLTTLTLISVRVRLCLSLASLLPRMVAIFNESSGSLPSTPIPPKSRLIPHPTRRTLSTRRKLALTSPLLPKAPPRTASKAKTYPSPVLKFQSLAFYTILSLPLSTGKPTEWICWLQRIPNSESRKP